MDIWRPVCRPANAWRKLPHRSLMPLMLVQQLRLRCRQSRLSPTFVCWWTPGIEDGVDAWSHMGPAVIALTGQFPAHTAIIACA